MLALFVLFVVLFLPTELLFLKLVEGRAVVVVSRRELLLFILPALLLPLFAGRSKEFSFLSLSKLAPGRLLSLGFLSLLL